MGVVSRKIIPACESMFVCCPALRSRSKQPVKRYKKLLADIFPRSLDTCPDERKITKLCEYAAKNPFRIPKITKCLERRCYKELRSERTEFVEVVTKIYNQFLCTCKEQMPYFTTSLLDVINELLDSSKHVDIQILGCQAFTKFIFAQADGTYAHNIESMVFKVCILVENVGADHRRCLRAAGLQCLSAMVWFMTEFSTIFVGFNKMVHVILENYELVRPNKDGDMSRVEHNYWVDEVVRKIGMDGSVVGNDHVHNYMISKWSPEMMDLSCLTSKEVENPKVWARICIQRMAELAKETTTMRRIVESMFAFFDSGKHWTSCGLAVSVLSDMSYFLETSENQHSPLSFVIHHLDHKNVAHNPETKSSVIQVATILVRQTRSLKKLGEIGYVGDLCRHLKKNMQLTVESVGEGHLKQITLLQCSIEECLLEIVEKIGNAKPLFDLMAVILEKLPPVGVVSRATIDSLIILARIVSLTLASSYVHKVFPDPLLVQILKAMFHPDNKARASAHQLFSVLLYPGLSQFNFGATSIRSNYIYMEMRHPHPQSSSSSISMLLEKINTEKGDTCCNKHACEETKADREEEKQPPCPTNSSLFCKPSSMIDNDMGTYIAKFDEDQIAHLLSGFWLQTNLPDNLPSNFEAIVLSLSLTIMSLCLKNPDENQVVRVCQLILSLRRLSIDLNNAISPANRRSILVVSTSLLMFLAKIYHIPDLVDVMKPSIPFDFDPYLYIGDDFQVHVKPGLDAEQYDSYADNEMAASFLSDIQKIMSEHEDLVVTMLGKGLSTITKFECHELVSRLCEEFVPEGTFFIGSQAAAESDHMQLIPQSDQSLSFDQDITATSFGEDGARGDLRTDASCLISSPVPAPLNAISIGQVMQSVRDVAGHAATSDVAASAMPYCTMTGQCEALGTGKVKLPTWLACETSVDQPSVDGDDQPPIGKVKDDNAGLAMIVVSQPWLTLRLPPASPFDNFLRAARC